MLAATVLNHDVWEQIVDLFCQESAEDARDTTDIQALNALSLTCKAMVPICRRHLFSSLSLDKGMKYSSKFNHLINENPEILHYIRRLTLTYCVYAGIASDSIHVQAILSSILRERSAALRSLELDVESEWTSLPGSLQTSLEALIQLPSVTELRLLYATEVPLTIFASGNLTHLTLHCVGFATSESLAPDDPDPSRAIVTSRPIFLHARDGIRTIRLLSNARAHGPAGPGNEDQLKVMDFSGLRTMEFMMLSKEETEVVWELLQTTTEVQSLKLKLCAFDPQLSYAGLGAALSVCAFSTLRRLDLYYEVDKEGDDEMRVISNELKAISGMNVLEEINLSLLLNARGLLFVNLEAWSDLDVLVTTSGLFPQLKSVSFVVGYWSCETWRAARTGPGGSVLAGIRLDLFHRLPKSGAIKFMLSRNIHCGCSGPGPCTYPR